jgi:hypothetical protein
MGTLALPGGDPAVNDGNFRALLRFRSDAGDVALKEHLEPCMRNTTYISPKIQNEIIATCGDIIVEDIKNRITQSGFFSVLEGETTDVAGMSQLLLQCSGSANKATNRVLVRQLMPVKANLINCKINTNCII